VEPPGIYMEVLGHGASGPKRESPGSEYKFDLLWNITNGNQIECDTSLLGEYVDLSKLVVAPSC
jgi:hypothetical protein